MRKLEIALILGALIVSSVSFAKESETTYPSPREAALNCSRALSMESGRVSHTIFAPDAGNFYNADFLLEFFGPNRNLFTSWLKALELQPGSKEPITVHRLGTQFFVGKTMEFPYDGGASEFYNSAKGPEGDFDPTQPLFKPLLKFDFAQASSLWGPSSEAQAAREELLHQLDVKLFGIYGVLDHILTDQWVLHETKYDFALLSSAFPEAKLELESKHDWMDMWMPSFTAPPSPLLDFNDVAQVIHQDDKTVLVRVKLGRGSEPKNKNQDLIQKMFFITHWQLVQKAYRQSGLFSDDLNSALYLLDNFINSANESIEPQDLYLMYDVHAWKSILHRMARVHQYTVLYQSVGLVQQRWKYQTISNVFSPFYPIYGMMVEHHNQGPYEFKRLFANENPDPLSFFEPIKNLRRLNLKFYSEVTQQIPKGALVQAISKTPQHTNLYKSYGFHLEKSEHNPEWNSQMDTLTQPRDAFLEFLKPHDSK